MSDIIQCESCGNPYCAVCDIRQMASCDKCGKMFCKSLTTRKREVDIGR